MTDARIVRTRASLRAAILKLASEKPVTEITVSELASTADINRVTFYKHYASPEEALSEAIQNELDVTREAMLQKPDSGTRDGADALVHGFDLVLEHVARNRCIYENSVAANGNGAVPWAITEHLTTTFNMYYTERAGDAHDNSEWEIDIISGFLGAGLVGAVYSWIASGETDTAPLIDTVKRMISVWYLSQQD